MHNKLAALAREVLIHGPVSRSALSTRLDLSPATATRLSRQLVDSGLLVELDEQLDGTVGRPSRPLDIASDAGSVVGVTLAGDQRLHVVVTDLRAQVSAARELRLVGRSPRAVTDQIVAVIAELGAESLLGIGVSLGATVRDGVVVHSPFLDWDDVALGALLEQRTGVPVSVENDLVALAEAERWFGVGRDAAGFAVVTIGTGIGFSLVVGGAVVRSPDDGIGTTGHLRIGTPGPVCPDGHAGCINGLLTIGAITGQISVALGRTVTYQEALTLARRADPVATRVVEAAGEALGTLIALTANLTLQSTMVLAGDGIELYDLTRDQVTAVVADLRSPQAQPVTIHARNDDYGEWARGAAVVAIQAALERLSR